MLLILLTALSDPDQYHYQLTRAELANSFHVMDDASKCWNIATMTQNQCPYEILLLPPIQFPVLNSKTLHAGLSINLIALIYALTSPN